MSEGRGQGQGHEEAWGGGNLVVFIYRPIRATIPDTPT